jgi:spore photoproduct lyase
LSYLKKDYYNEHFSHIYIEKDIRNHPNTQNILSHFPRANLIEINHYKEIFCRSHQNYCLQKQSPKLILAKKQNSLMYEGAPVCQDFGNKHFYYTSQVMNCIYDCEYCYLQGMYPSGNIVVFVNLEDIFYEIEQLLMKHPVYLCISYDTDLLALEHILGYVKSWFSFASKHPDLTLELRTKSANWTALSSFVPCDNIILAWTLSPENIVKRLEHHTPTLRQRLSCIQKSIDFGFPVRLCFDPIIDTKDFRTSYEEFIRIVFEALPKDKIKDASIGVFRVSQDYLKQMRKQRSNSSVLFYPYENDNGVFHYSKERTEEMLSFVLGLLKEYLPEDKIFQWKEAT